jgi:carboxypeptidase Taq
MAPSSPEISSSSRDGRTPQAAYAELVRRARDRTTLESCLELLSWDELTYMPRGGVENRRRQVACIAGLLHEQATRPDLGELLEIVVDSPLVAEPLSAPAVNIREWRRLYHRQSRLPRSLVEELASVTTAAQQQWSAARQDDAFAQFLPWLELVVRLKQQEADCLGYVNEPYDALLDEYEPNMRAVDIEPIFGQLRSDLAALLEKLADAPRPTNPAVLRREFAVERQRIFGEAVAADLGFDFERGRLDSTVHPFFSRIGPGDCRITARYNPHDFGDGFFSILHELGHALYEQGLDPLDHGTPMGEAASMGIHESQSRLWDNVIGRSLAFWTHFFPRAREVFHDALHDVSLNDFYRAINHVQPGWDRVRADAVTYDLHVMLRFDLERDLISGNLQPCDLPAAWNARSMQYLGILPDSDCHGCLQDGHWSAGQFGYFPTYTLGNLYAAQFYARIREDLPDLDGQLARGEFAGLAVWLRENIYRHGQRYQAADLVEHVTGSRPDHRPFVRALYERCAEVYGIG